MPAGRFILPETPLPEGRVLAVLCIPDEPQHIAAFWGALQILGYQHAWERDDDHTATPVSVLWSEILREAHDRFNGAPMFCGTCEELTECLTPLINQAVQKIVHDTRYPNSGGATPGQPMSQETLLTNLAGDTNPTCDLNKHWAACQAVIEYAHGMVLAAMANAETATNKTEMIGRVFELPVLNEAIIGAIADYVDALLSGVSENYVAQASPEYLAQAAFDLFCRTKANCVVTIQAAFDVFIKRWNDHFGTAIDSFLTVYDFLTYFADQDIDGSTIADALMLLCFGTGKLASSFLGDVGALPLILVVHESVDDANDGWTFMGECVDYWEHRFDLTEGLIGWVINAPYGHWQIGQGVDANGQTQVSIYRTWVGPANITRVRFETADATPLFQTMWHPDGEHFIQGNAGGNPETIFTVNTENEGGYTAIEGIECRVTINGIDVYTSRLLAITFSGIGFQPNW